MTEITREFISIAPKIVKYENLLSEEDCAQLLSFGLNYNRSLGYDLDKDNSGVVKERTSTTAWDTDDGLVAIRHRIFQLVKPDFWFMDFTMDNLEVLQVQKYEPGQEYVNHCDFFNYPEHPTITGNDRIATMIIYLNDDFTGGETVFPLLNVTVKPKRGMGLFFDYKYIYELNRTTLHAGTPVIEGTKNIVTCWIRRLPYPANR